MKKGVRYREKKGVIPPRLAQTPAFWSLSFTAFGARKCIFAPAVPKQPAFPAQCVATVSGFLTVGFFPRATPFYHRVYSNR